MSRDAINTPVKAASKEQNTGTMHINQRDDIDMDDSPLLRVGESLVAVDIDLNQAYMEALAFAEEPVCIRIEKSTQKNPPKTVPCWVQGKGAEIFKDGKWWVLGFLPIGTPIITRRKYIEAIARAKVDTVDTEHASAAQFTTGAVNYIENKVCINTSALYPLSVIRDNNPKGADWLTKIMAEY